MTRNARGSWRAKSRSDSIDDPGGITDVKKSSSQTSKPLQSDSSATRLSLISRVRSDDSRAWQELVELYTPLVAFWCRKRGLRESEIGDTIRDVFFAVCRSLESYTADQTGGCFRASLWTISRNKIIDSLR